MDRNEKIVLARNAISNVARGGAASLVAVLLPPFLTRLMSPEGFGVWSLVLQLSAYVGYLDFGIQTAVGRFVAHANERGDTECRNGIASTALAVLIAAGTMGLAGIAIAAVVLPNIFRQLPGGLVGDARAALLLVGCSLAVGLPASVFTGIFVGLQRYEVPAAIIGGSRVVSAILVVFVVSRGGSLARMGMAVAGVNLVSYFLQYAMYRRLAPTVRLSAHLISLETGRQLFRYCLSLSVWTSATLLITGLDVLLVAYFQFEAVPYYAVAATLVTFLAGLQNAVFGVMIPSTAVQHARGDWKELGRTMVTATRYGSFLLLITGLPLILAAREILSLWMGPAYAVHGVRVLQILAAANVIRLLNVPYVMALIGTGQQRLVVVTPLLEGFSNLLVSLIAGFMYGALGVAVGTLVGSLAGMAGNLVYNMRRTVGVEFRISDYLRDGLLRPAICALPPIVSVVLLQSRTESALLIRYVVLAAALTATAILVWRLGLIGQEREKLRLWCFASQT